MRLLGIETSDVQSSVALYEEGRLRAEDIFYSRMVLCDQLARRINALLDGDFTLDGIAVSIGPGSFTGLRIGVTTAKALGHSLQVPVAGVNTQHVLAAGCGPAVAPVAVVQRARRGYVYCGIYSVHGQHVETIRPVEALDIDAAAGALGEAQIAVGSGVATLADEGALPAHIQPAPPSHAAPRASVTIGLAQWPEEYRFDDVADLRPNYMLESQAERHTGIYVD
ncbi:MAG: tRNA (adenosine(37)-N6)-threonylcarbamoyltransferase complex dimerization subunit type 1 TsaB [Armatimonadota bacterium]